jgi:hypothetical protein
MSSAYLVTFVNGVADSSYEFGNSWGGAARIWDSLFQKYIEKIDEYDNWLRAGADKRLWQVWKDPRLQECERLVYFLCCDDALVKREDFTKMAEAIRKFKELHPSKEGHVCHLNLFAEVFETETCDAIGMHATSVCENPWIGWDEKTDEAVPYNFLTGTKHWFVYDKQKDE